MRLLTNRQFVEDLERSLCLAERRVLIQVMTFDGDGSGLALAGLMAEAAGRGADVRLLVDCFALRYVSDRPARLPEVAAEAAETSAMFERLRSAGVAVAFTQPWGPLLLFGLSRNHKKIYVVDDHAYIGGINISDHNFAWRDFMVRVENPAVVSALADDFARTERGERRRSTGRAELVGGSSGSAGSSFSRRSAGGAVLTDAEIEPVFNNIVDGASRSLVLVSPYSLDVGIVRRLERCPALSVTVVTARVNNFRMLRAAEHYIWGRLARAGVELHTYPDFFHARFLLADDARLLVGSSNFSRHSFRCNRELCLLITDAEFIAGFKALMMADVVRMEHSRPRPGIARAVADTWSSMAAHFYFHVILGAAQVVAPHAPTLARA